MRKLSFLLSGTLALLLTGCSETPAPTAKKAPEKPEPITGQSALFKMYGSARLWAPDAQVLKLNTILLSDVPDVPRGKAAAWQAVFVSPSRSQSRTYTYSIVEEQGNLHKGTFGQQEEAWSGPHGDNAPFLMAAVKVDTDAAYETALKEGTDYDKKNPGKPITFLLEKIAKFPDPVWRVIWGESVGTSNFSVYVDSSTGMYQEKMH
ncbi:MAG TPA: hypothetical protein VKU19_11285 [Bryobacteraceae bacterium]|nr:hypothetical protein [Bryobacteraceae bacterium]